MAFILEAIEIKRLWPAYNRSMKRFEQGYGLFMFEDQKGYLRLAIDKYKKYAKPVYKFYQLFEGYSILRQLIDNYNLCPKLCFVHKSNENCKSITGSNCKGACEGLEESSVYNSRVQQALEKLQTSLPTFAFVDEGRNYRERSCFLLEGGIFYGMGYLDNNFQHYKLEDIKSKLQPCTTNDYICNMILNHASRYPEKVVLFE
jgi:DNA polymerase-3 subunit epsilon